MHSAWYLKMMDYNRPEPEMETYKPYKRPTEYWCNDDEQVRIIEAALDLYEKFHSHKGEPMTYEAAKCRNEEGWTVEAFGDEGECYKTNFYGPKAEARAKEYAAFKR